MWAASTLGSHSSSSMTSRCSSLSVFIGASSAQSGSLSDDYPAGKRFRAVAAREEMALSGPGSSSTRHGRPARWHHRPPPPGRREHRISSAARDARTWARLTRPQAEQRKPGRFTSGSSSSTSNPPLPQRENASSWAREPPAAAAGPGSYSRSPWPGDRGTAVPPARPAPGSRSVGLCYVDVPAGHDPVTQVAMQAFLELGQLLPEAADDQVFERLARTAAAPSRPRVLK